VSSRVGALWNENDDDASKREWWPPGLTAGPTERTQARTHADPAVAEGAGSGKGRTDGRTDGRDGGAYLEELESLEAEAVAGDVVDVLKARRRRSCRRVWFLPPSRSSPQLPLGSHVLLLVAVARTRTGDARGECLRGGEACGGGVAAAPRRAPAPYVTLGYIPVV
jgi:hypothetical protein